MEDKANLCKCPHHNFLSGLVFLFGLLFFLHAFGVFSERFVDIAWPVIVGAAGLFKMMEGGCKCCKV